MRTNKPDAQEAVVIADTKKKLSELIVPGSPAIVTVKGTPMYVEAEETVIEVTLLAEAAMQPSPGPYVVIENDVVAAAPELVAVSGETSNTRSVSVVVALEESEVAHA